MQLFQKFLRNQYRANDELFHFSCEFLLFCLFKGSRSQDRKSHDTHRRDRILCFFLRPEIGQISPHLGAISLQNYTENLEKEEKSLEKKNPLSGEGAPKLQISVPCYGRTLPEGLSPSLQWLFWGRARAFNYTLCVQVVTWGSLGLWGSWNLAPQQMG